MRINWLPPLVTTWASILALMLLSHLSGRSIQSSALPAFVRFRDTLVTRSSHALIIWYPDSLASHKYRCAKHDGKSGAQSNALNVRRVLTLCRHLTRSINVPHTLPGFKQTFVTRSICVHNSSANVRRTQKSLAYWAWPICWLPTHEKRRPTFP